jgi:methyl-accepting chemotaxis protein
MKYVNNLRVGVRLGAAFGAVVLLLCTVAVVGLAGGASQGSAAQTLSERMALTRDAMQIKFRAADFNGWQTAYAFDITRGVKGATSDDAASRKAFLGAADTFRSELDAVRKQQLTPGEQADVASALRAFNAFMATDTRIIRLYRTNTAAGTREASDLVLGQEVKQYNAISAGVDRLVALVQAEGQAASASAKSAQASTRTGILLVGFGALLVAGFLAFAITRSVTRPLAEVGTAADKIAEGDLDVKLTADSKDEIGLMARSFGQAVAYLQEMAGTAGEIANGNLAVHIDPRSERDVLGNAFSVMRGKIAGMVRDIASTSETVSAASQQMAATSEEAGRATGEIANAVGDIAHGAERTAQMVETAVRSAEEVTRAVGLAAENAQRTAEVAGEAREVAERGVGAAEQANAAMQSVRDSSTAVTEAIRELAAKSDQIGAIVQTITGIAEQTNLLALNAAIEAARAGEQGKGFAVVAEEVRKLAEESQAAAQEISTLIGAIQSETANVVGVVEDGAERTQEGAGVVEQTREAFQHIGTAVEDMTARIEQIAAAAQQVAATAAGMQDSIAEVAAVAEQSSASTEEVSASTEETSASAQEIAASAQELSGNAETLNGLIAQFRVAD